MRFKRLLSKAFAVVLASSMVFFDQSIGMAGQVLAQELSQETSEADDNGWVDPSGQAVTSEEETEGSNSDDVENPEDASLENDEEDPADSKGQPGDPAESETSETSETPDYTEDSETTELAEIKPSESASDKEAQTTFTWSDDQVEVTAVLEQNAVLPEGTVLSVKPVNPGSNLYEKAVDQVEEEHKGTRFTEHLVYDITFELNGEKVEPEGGTVSVTLNYKQSVLKKTDNADLIVSHITEDNQVENLNRTLSSNTAGCVDQVSFTTDSFSPFVLSQTREATEGTAVFVYENWNSTAKVTLDGVTFDFSASYLVMGDDARYSVTVTREDLAEDQNIAHGVLIGGQKYKVSILKDDDPAIFDGTKQIDVTITDLSASAEDDVYATGFDGFNNPVDLDNSTFHSTFNNDNKATITIHGLNESAELATGKWSLSPATYESTGGKYSLEYLYGNYQAVSFTDYVGSHFVGPCLVNGTLKGSIGGVSNDDFDPYPWTVPAYAGIIGGASKQATTYSDVPFYLGQAAYESTPNDMMLIGPGGNSYYNYIFTEDFLQAEEFKAKMVSLANNYSGTPQTIEGTSATISIGGSYEFGGDKFSTLDTLTLNGNFESNDPTFIIVHGDTVKIPKILVDKESNPTIAVGTGEVASIETGHSTKVVFVFPDATEVTFDKGMSGHILAPNAKVTGSGGYYNGGIIANNIDVSQAEGHMWPFKNMAVIEKTSHKVTKVWNVDDYASRPGYVYVTLMNGDQPVGTQQILYIGNNWTYEWTGLNKYDAEGKEIDYSIVESGVSEEYLPTVEKVDADGNVIAKDDTTTPVAGFNLINTQIIEIQGSKTWNDNNNAEQKRPGSITVSLYQGEGESKTLVEKITTDEAANWAWSFGSLPKFDEEGKEILYSIEEQAVEGYTTTYDGYNITNTLETEELTSRTVTKVWDDNKNQDGKRPESIQIILKADGNVKDTVTLNEENNWTYTWTGLPEKANGTTIGYSVEEEKVDGYEASMSEDGWTITNTHVPSVITLTGSKTWIDNDNQNNSRPETITVRLFADGKQVREQTVSKEDGWTWTFSELPEFNAGKKITYTLQEDSVDGYLSKVEGMNVTNTATSVSISKVDIADGKEVEGATIQIVDKDGKVVEEWVSGKDAHEVKGLKTGETYTLKETVAPDGYTITTETTFTMKEDGTIDSSKTTTKVSEDGILLVEDAKTSVSISKVDIANGRELVGAKLQILDKDGKVVKEWTSSKQPEIITGLNVLEKYTLREITAPNGYLIAADTTFELNADGSINKSKTTTKISDQGILFVEDAAKPAGKPDFYTPATGAGSGIALYSSLLLGSSASVLALLKKKKKHQE